MNCGFDQALISSYADGAAIDDVVHNVEDHLANCESCTTMFTELRVLEAAIRTIHRKQAPAELIDRILFRAEAGVHEKRRMSLMKLGREIWRTLADGFEIGNERQEVLRGKLPEWVARWVMYI